MIKFICLILVIVIKDLKICYVNINQFLEKNEICFEPLIQKKEINKQIIHKLFKMFIS